MIKTYRISSDWVRSERVWQGIGATAALLSMFAMFAFVSPPVDGAVMPHDLTDAAAITDLRALTGTSQTDRATGTLTAAVSPEDVLEILGAAPHEAEAVMTAFKLHDLLTKQDIRPGLKFTAHMTGDDLTAVTVKTAPGRSLIARRSGTGGYHAAVLNARLRDGFAHHQGVIKKSLAETLSTFGAGKAQQRTLSAMFAYDPAFGRLRKSDELELVLATYEDERGNFIEAGDVLYARVAGRSLSGEFYRYTAKDTGITDYYDASGRAGKRFLKRRPLAKVKRIASGFGLRRHPIYGYSHLHSGVDYSAPISTEVYAAGAGIVTEIGRRGGYGRYIRIRHDRGFETAYAHLSGYDRRMVVGRRVSQGDLIGFVGDTGDATGPHLHYEIIHHGRKVNPLTLPLPSGRNLQASPAEYARFLAHKRKIDALRGVEDGLADESAVQTAALQN